MYCIHSWIIWSFIFAQRCSALRGDVNINYEKSPFITKSAAVIFNKIVKRSLTEECVGEGGCSYEEVAEAGGNCGTLVNLKCHHTTRCGPLCRCGRSGGDCGSYGGMRVSCFSIFKYRESSIPNCVNETYVDCHNAKCVTCDYGYYVDSGKCSACPSLDHCIEHNCTDAHDVRCKTCELPLYYKLYNGRCIDICSSRNRWCWPGTCSSYYAFSCTCSPGFVRRFSSSEVTCQPQLKPNISQCFMKVEDIRNDVLLSPAESSDCSHQRDFYGNIQIVKLTTNVTFDFKINIMGYTRPAFVQRYLFGITDAEVMVVKKTISGYESITSRRILKSDPNGESPQTVFFQGDIELAGVNVVNGERLCLRIHTKGGGHLISNDVITRASQSIPYDKTETSRDLCYMYDDVAPKHCLETSTCTHEPLILNKRITTERYLSVQFDGWSDPHIIGYPSTGSQIEFYEITVHEVKPMSLTTLSADPSPRITLITTSTSMELQLPDTEPMLYAIVLLVKDVAGNYQQARRFALFDNSTEVRIDVRNDLKATSCTKESHYLWQTNLGNICYNWENRFYNSKFRDVNYLQQIQQDHHGLITGIYEQSDGILPVKGTTNIDGIIDFQYTLKINNQHVFSKQSVTNATEQSLCISPHINDGDIVDLNLIALDIVGHSLNDSTTIYIDSSPPEISNAWLVRDHHKQLYVHNAIDMSQMKLEFESMDPHSGIHTVHWCFGSNSGECNIGQGVLGVVRLLHNETCISDSCYYPSVGVCEYYNYSLNLNALVANNTHMGQHNRDYHFKLTVMNTALLSTEHHVQILVDDSPPAKGMVREGLDDSSDIDYTSEDEITVYWRGFLDPESGIKFYRVGIASYCLTLQEMENSSNIAVSDTWLKNIKFHTNGEGKYFSTVIAFNKAIEPSQPSCSDGFVKDKSAPILTEVTLINSRIKSGIYCDNGSAFQIFSNLQKKKVDFCDNLCHNTSNKILRYLVDADDADKSPNKTCKNIIPNATIMFYLPSDRIHAKWKIYDNESQIRNVYVGFGSNLKEQNYPDILPYEKSMNKTLFIKHSAGFQSGLEVFMFIKSINKAGVFNIVSFGPIVVDETEPVCPEYLQYNVDKTTIFIGWKTGELIDFEMGNELPTVWSRLYTAQHPVTSLQKADMLSSEDCPTDLDYCFKFDIRTMLHRFTGQMQPFYCQAFIYNQANLSCSVTSRYFHILSNMSRTHGLIFDLDKRTAGDVMLRDVSDIDISLSEGDFCIAMVGFDQHPGLNISLGVGAERGKDNIVPFHRIEYSDIYCESSTNLEAYRKYYISINLSDQYGTFSQSSDGVFIVREIDILKSIRVLDGPMCRNVIERQTIGSLSPSEERIIRFSIKVFIGRKYTLLFKTSSFSILIASNDTFLFINGSEMTSFIEDVSLNNRVDIISSVDHPSFLIKNQDIRNVSDFIMEIQDCEYDVNFHSFRSSSSVHWEVNQQFLQYISYFYVSLARVCHKNENCSVKYMEMASKTLHADSELELDFVNLNLKSSDTYVHLVKPCLSHTCLESVLSNGFTVIGDVFTGAFSSQLVSTVGNCSKISMKWDNFICDSTDHSIIPMFYKWRIYIDISFSIPASDWQTMLSQELPVVEEESCILIDVQPHSPMYSCIQGFCPSGISKTLCEKLQMLEDPNIYPKQTVYDMDATSAVFEELKLMVHSTNIGQYLSYFHHQELDYAFPNTVLGGVSIGLNSRVVKWYLMIKRYVPVSGCNDDDNCIAERESTNGFVVFKSVILQPNMKYYICMKANTSTIVREVFSEMFDYLELCSNGVIIDNTPPSTGKVVIWNTNGYISNPSAMITWSGITDNTDQNAKDFEGIADLHYSIGTSPYNQDVLPYTQSFQPHGSIARNLDVKNGMTYFANVKATDYVGLFSVSVSKGVILDITAPVHGKISVGNIHRHSYFIGQKKIEIFWSGFNDKESGIIKEEIGIGSSNQSVDIVQFVSAERKGFAEIEPDHKFEDGHRYYCFIRVTNGAQLTSAHVSSYFTLDRSWPNVGVVLDGPRDGQADLDFQTNTTTLWSHWNGFNDPHSSIAYYKAGIGTSRTETNIKPLAYVGLRRDMAWHINHLKCGQSYYVIVQACNRADVCRVTSSNGVIIDNSPPIPGIVEVGVHGKHSIYIPSRTLVHVQWIGFHDPQSSIKRYGFCIGKSPETCDVIKEEDVGLSLFFTKTNINMPLSTQLYVQITAYNHVDLYVKKSSNFFIVDDSPPITVRRPTFSYNNTLLSKYPGYQWDTSLIEIEWEFKDPESHISRHFLSLYTHHDGHNPVQNIEVADVSRITFQVSEGLRSGDVYYVTVTACNAAELCTNSESEGLTIDSTPPLICAFVSPMSWTNRNKTTEIAIEWTGFVDVESEIKSTFITVGSTYSGMELSGGVIRIENNSSSPSSQETSINLTELLQAGDKIILSIWAENHAGLMSDIARVTLELVSTDILQTFGLLIEERHSCDIHYCNKDCTCAIVGRMCSDVIGNSTCVEHTLDVHDTNVTIKSAIMSNTIASSVCVSAEWNAVSDFPKQVLRYEWSIGILGHPYGAGIFNTITENVWHDVGKRSEIIFCLSNTRQFTHGYKYVFYVRSWTSFNNYSVTGSDPVLIDTTPPSLSIGGSIKVNTIDSCQENMRYLTKVDSLSACWDNVFRDPQSGIQDYSVFLGTSPGVSDVVKPILVTAATNHTWSFLSLYSRTHYYVTVVARNRVGLETSTSSQYFVIDTDSPTAGIVYNTKYFKNKFVQSSTSELEISWTGFYDMDSFILNYEVAYVDQAAYHETNLDFINVGLHTSYKIFGANLSDGHSYISTVRAIDAAGYSSEIVKSQPILIDITPPVGYSCRVSETVYVRNIVLTGNVTFTDIFLLSRGTAYNFRIVSMVDILHDVSVEFSVEDYSGLLNFRKMHNGSWKTEYEFVGRENENVMFSLLPLNYHGKNIESQIYLDKCDSLIETVNSVRVSQISMNEISISVFTTDIESGISDMKIGIGFSKQSYQVKALESIGVHHTVYEVHVPHGTPIFVTAIADNHAGLSSAFHNNVLIMDHTPPSGGDIKMNVIYSVDPLNQTLSTMNIRWTVHDSESGIMQCYCALGTHKGTQNVKEWFRSNENSKCVTDVLNIAHGTTVHGSVRCVNNVELYSDLYSEPVIVSFMKPSQNNIGVTIIDNSLTYVDGNLAQSDSESLQFYWSNFIDASGRLSYQYRISELKLLSTNCNKTLNITNDFNETLLQCNNNGSVNLSNSTSENFRSQFTNNELTNWNDIGQRSFVTVSHLDFEDGIIYKLEIKAINIGLKTSDSSHTEILIDGREPERTGTDIVSISSGNGHYNISWDNVFYNPTIFDMSYVIVVGTEEGFNDILDVETNKERAVVEVAPDANFLHIVLTAKLQTGTETNIASTIVL